MRILLLFIILWWFNMVAETIAQESPKQKNQPFKKSDVDWSALADTLQDRSYYTYLSNDKKYFIQDNTGNQKFNYWWNAHALDAFVDAYLRTGNEKYKQWMKSILSGIKDANGGTYLNDYYDDMEWLGLASLRAFHVTNDQEFLETATFLWTDIKTAYNDTMGGGLSWRKSQRYYKNTPANAPAIILACRLYKIKKQKGDLILAHQLYNWLKETLVEKPSGFVKDGINRKKDGKIDPWKFTYNQGVFIGAALELYDISNDKSFLNDAIRTADYVISSKDFNINGVLKSEGNEDGGLFKGILVRYLALLSQHKDVPVKSREAYKKLINSNAEILAKKGIKRPEFLVGDYWGKAPEEKTDYSTQLSGIMLIEAAYQVNQN